MGKHDWPNTGSGITGDGNRCTPVVGKSSITGVTGVAWGLMRATQHVIELWDQ